MMSMLRDAGHEVALFSTSPFHSWPRSTRGSLFRSSDGRDARPDRTCFDRDLAHGQNAFRKTIAQFQPHAVGLSALSSNFHLGMEYVRAVPKSFVFVVGGVHATLCPDQVIADPYVDAVCVGEAEPMILSFAQRCAELQRDGIDFSGICNLWYRDALGTVHRNSTGQQANLEKLPSLSRAGLEPELGHFVGRKYRRYYGETSRGCPYDCSFCSNAALTGAAGLDRKRVMRRMSPERAVSSFSILKKTMRLEMLRILDENFLAAPKDWLQEFCARYTLDVALPFTISATAKLLTMDRVALIKRAGCVNVNFGVESGNELFRRQVLNKSTSDSELIAAADVLIAEGLRANTGVIIGLPGQDDAIIEQTVELLRRMKLPASIEFFLPSPGSRLHRDVVTRGEFADLKNAYDCYRALGDPVYIAQHTSREELIALSRTMLLYARLPQTLRPIIDLCREDTPDGNRILDALEATYAF